MNRREIFKQTLVVLVVLIFPKEAWVARFPDIIPHDVNIEGPVAKEIATYLQLPNPHWETALEVQEAGTIVKPKITKLIWDSKTLKLSFLGYWLLNSTGSA